MYRNPPDNLVSCNSEVLLGMKESSTLMEVQRMIELENRSVVTQGLEWPLLATSAARESSWNSKDDGERHISVLHSHSDIDYESNPYYELT